MVTDHVPYMGAMGLTARGYYVCVKREFPTHLYQMFGYSGRRIGVQRDGKDLDGDIP